MFKICDDISAIPKISNFLPTSLFGKRWALLMHIILGRYLHGFPRLLLSHNWNSSYKSLPLFCCEVSREEVWAGFNWGQSQKKQRCLVVLPWKVLPPLPDQGRLSRLRLIPCGVSSIVCHCGLSSSSRCSWLCWWWLGARRLSALSSAAAFFSYLLLVPSCLLITSLQKWDQLAHTHTYPHPPLHTPPHMHRHKHPSRYPYQQYWLILLVFLLELGTGNDVLWFGT